MNLKNDTMKKSIERMSDIFEEYKTNPDYWSNNKRKMYSIPMRRKQNKIKRKTYWRRKHRQQFLNAIEFIIDETFDENILDVSNDFIVDIKNFECGDKNNGDISV